MKVTINYLHEATKPDKKNRTERNPDSKRDVANESDAQDRLRRPSDPTLKEDSKFISFLQSAPKTEKPKEKQQEDSGNNRQNDAKKSNKTRESKETKETKESDEKDSVDSSTGDGKTEKFEDSAGGSGQFGGQSGFGERGNINFSNLNDAFAARSILHIADLERMVSTIRTQTALSGKREIVLQLRRSVLEGLQVKITTDPSAKVHIEFLAASDKVRSEIEKHSSELAQILRGRGINLESLKTIVKSGSQNDNNEEREKESLSEISLIGSDNESVNFDDNTFDNNNLEGNRVYSA